MNDNIRQKLFNYSETPPVSAWNRIAEALEENPEYAQKLDDFEQQPPAGIWEKIDQQLSATKVIPLRTKLFKYAMAAAVLIAITVGSIIYLKSGTASGLTHTAQKSDSNNSANSFTDSQSQSGSKTNVARYDDPSGGDNTNVNGTAAITDRTTVHYATQVRILKDGLTDGQLTVMPEEKNIIATNLQDRYIIATTPTGKVVRLPKKAYSDYACAEAYQNYQCKQKIAAIQSKMAASVATDFTDFIDLLKKLQDNP